ncbi:unnamed protein product (macronuclear) [Paramecium tetraurelia]|uniref:Uncharacterized protein n=1 Tax=Paramecium tetraurelia TaxID=5888 RepID=A0BF41_PARTE|nr:uncharacterized protein GSPATT00028193001 [Paramecium tetraurelia]CAK57158.1 unnamed protein product [Paramecium tetraurelia]|eukprot:XP_001424556.1 hypothetical protein (macronuclear) [Paramecium tetraurelia strain d4-2]
MQYQIQQIRQHISSIDRKFHPVPAFVVTRPLFTCRSLSPSFYRLSSKTTISPLSYSLVKINPTPIRENKFTFKGTDCTPSRETPISDLNDIKLTKVNSTHEKIMSESQERFYQKKRQSNINNNSTERVSHQNQSPEQFKMFDMPKVQKQELQLISQEKSKQNQDSKNNGDHIHKIEQLQKYCEQQTSNEVFNIYNQRQDKQKISSNQDKNDIEQVIKELPEVIYQDQTQQQQQSGMKLWACSPNDSQRQSVGRKCNQKRSSKKSPLKTPKSPKKQHIIHYNQIFLYKPRENNKQNSSKLSYNSSSKYISPRRQSKQISYILTTPSKRNTRAPPQSNEDEEIEIINLAPEFSKLI